jgi:hypothetical protein
MLIEFLENSINVAKVSVDGSKAFCEVGQSPARGVERRRVTIDAYDASLSRGFKDRFTVSTKANRAIDKETSSLWSEELHRFS